jgi:hypothetical protein
MHIDGGRLEKLGAALGSLGLIGRTRHSCTTHTRFGDRAQQSRCPVPSNHAIVETRVDQEQQRHTH